VGSPGLEAFHSAKSRGLRFSLVAKSASPSAASSSAAFADDGLSLRYWCPAALPCHDQHFNTVHVQITCVVETGLHIGQGFLQRRTRMKHVSQSAVHF
jgi:hypothetical protein